LPERPDSSVERAGEEGEADSAACTISGTRVVTTRAKQSPVEKDFIRDEW
jgi:hypothetical protein